MSARFLSLFEFDLETVMQGMVDPQPTAGDEVVTVDVAKLDQLFKNDEGFHVGPGGEGGVAGRYQRFQQFLQTGTPVEMPQVSLQTARNGKMAATFTNGRHRFAVLRDMGAKAIKVAMTPDSAELARQLGIVHQAGA